MNGRLSVSPSVEALTQSAARQIALLLNGAVHSRSRAMVALSGGGTPQGVYALLASGAFRSDIPWECVHVFWGDERCVSPEHPESNFRMAHEVLLRHVGVPASHVYRIMGELKPEQAAREYEEELRQVFHVDRKGVPRFDLILLGLGGDGHTASLFPGTPVLNERQRLVSDVFVEKLKSFRVTLTYPVMNNARHVLFLVSGKSKAAILADVLHGTEEGYPARGVRPVAGDLEWLVDQDAASQLEPEGRS